MRELNPLGANLLYLKCPISTLPRWFTTFGIYLPTVTATEPWRPGTNWSAIMDPAYPAANRYWIPSFFSVESKSV